MFKLQIFENGQWRVASAAFRNLIPEDCDVLDWARSQYRGTRFRIVWVKGEN